MTTISPPSPYQDYYDYLAEHVIAPFYETRLNNLRQLKLLSVLKRKNPYLFKAKNIQVAGELVTGILDAYLSSQEETMFGNLLEGFAIHIAAARDNGVKSDEKASIWNSSGTEPTTLSALNPA